ncbi:site-2 protease family protein [Solwaraspora sp. WMMD406]|uniref:site-2 protease family protein n=1 Tax=Solwaraspora sp. WMMD406 TaxID=3016095 RepID=UPI002415AC9E|nr:site-2 protease family protein [Solwaraspora sp. WMMD406]MDG4766238.1 site-2 protease family protein [Solwaraspora sp. WMMD406]
MFGFPVHLNASVLLLAILVTVVYAEFVRGQLDVGQPARYAVGLGFVVCLLGSVLLHELGHALTARRYGIGVRGITLEMLGGYTEMDRDAPTPKVDLLVSLAGPAVSLVLGIVAVVAAVLLPDQTLINQLAFQLAVANILVAVFNSLPGLPLDGGRALRAAVWAVTRDRHVGTEAAGWVGRVVAAGTAGLVVLLTLLGILSPFGLIFMLLVSFTMWQGAGQSIRVARIGRRFPLVDLAALARPIFPVPSGTPLAEAQRRGADVGIGPGRGEPTLGVADSAGRLVALVDRAAAAAVPPERRAWVAVDTVARGIDGLRRLPVNLAGEQVVRAVQEFPGSQYLVTRGDDLVGVLHVADLAQLLEPNRKMNP